MEPAEPFGWPVIRSPWEHGFSIFPVLHVPTEWEQGSDGAWRKVFFSNQESQQWDKLLAGGVVSICGVFQNLVRQITQRNPKGLHRWLYDLIDKQKVGTETSWGLFTPDFSHDLPVLGYCRTLQTTLTPNAELLAITLSSWAALAVAGIDTPRPHVGIYIFPTEFGS